MAEALQARHIQDFSDHSEIESHWGYADRQIPCTNDAASCEYLDVVYRSQDLGLIYVGIIWLTLVAIFCTWGVVRLVGWPKDAHGGYARRLARAMLSTIRHYLLQDDFLRPIFGRTTRLQVLILAALVAYLAIWSFVGIIYNTWLSPVKHQGHENLYSTRTSLGPWANRVGLLAYGLTPLSVLLSSRESVLSIITGVPYQSFNFLHRWLGYLMVVQSSLHTIGWCVVEARLYQPQPMEGQMWIKQLYMIWGIVALILLLALYVLTLPFVIRRTGYEFFRKSHYVLAMIYIGACIGHWEKLHCFLTPSIILWALDRLVRYIRTFLIHYKIVNYETSSSRRFTAAQAEATLLPDAADGDVVRLDFKHSHQPWKIGQHFYLCFTEGSIWQSHPFTPLSLPESVDGNTIHSYLFRAKSGETKKVADLLAAKKQGICSSTTKTPVLLTGPYGEDIMQSLSPSENVLCIAGGTGITYVLPVLLSLSCQQENDSHGNTRKVELVWFVRHRRDMDWIRPELQVLQSTDQMIDIDIRIFCTRDGNLDSPMSATNPFDNEKGTSKTGSTKRCNVQVQRTSAALTTTQGGHPDVRPLVADFLENTSEGPTTVFASGPGGMMSDLREAIAVCNSGRRVWKGIERYDVSLQCDDRLEY